MKKILIFLVAVSAIAQTRVNPGQIGPLVASSASIVIPPVTGQYAGSPLIGITGNTTVTSISGAFAGEAGTLAALNGPLTFTAGATIAAPCTTTNGSTYVWYFDGTYYWIVGPGCTTQPPSGSPDINVKKAPCFAKGDGVTDDSAAFSTCIGLATTLGVATIIPGSTYTVCNVIPTIPSGANIVIYGVGQKQSLIVRNSACYEAPLDMFDLPTTGEIYLHDFGVDMCPVGCTAGNTFSHVAILLGNTTSSGMGASLVDVNQLYVAHGQVVGLQVINSNNVTISNSTFYQNWWFGAAISCALGGTSSPTYNTNFNFHGNQYEQEPIGLGINFFCSNSNVVSETFTQANLSFVQVPHAKAQVSGVVIQGDPVYGCITTGQCGGYSTQDALFLEGVSDIDIGPVWISDIAHSSQGGIFCVGSNLTISPGSEIDLPCTNVHVHDSTLNNVTGDPILISGQSNGNNPIYGKNNSIKNTVVTNSNVCPVLGATIGADLSGNYCAASANGGFSASGLIDGYVGHNYCYNCNTAGGTTYSTGTISGSSGGTAITGSGTTFLSGMAGGGLTVNGTTYTIKTYNSASSLTLSSPLVTAASSSSYSIYYSGGGNYSGLNIGGTYTSRVEVDGNTFKSDAGTSITTGIQDSTTLTPAQSLVTYDTTNSCLVGCLDGLYQPAPVFIPSLTSCGTGSVSTDATNRHGTIQPGNVSSCTLVFSGSGWAGPSIPDCSVFSNTSGITFSFGGASSTSQLVINGSSSLSGVILYYACSGVLANSNYYPVQQ